MRTSRFLFEACFSTESFVLWKAPFCGKISFCGQLLITENSCLQKALICMNPHLVGIFFLREALFFGAKLYFAENSLLSGKLFVAENFILRKAPLCGEPFFFCGKLLIAKMLFFVGMPTLWKTSFHGKPLFERRPFFANNSFFVGNC